jgi:hypothetical protein
MYPVFQDTRAGLELSVKRRYFLELYIIVQINQNSRGK